MEKYRLLKDLPNAKAGEIFEYAAGKTQQLFSETSPATFSAQEIKEYGILDRDNGWFEKVREKEYGGRVPKEGDRYWFILSDGSICGKPWTDGEWSMGKFESGNAFWTREEAEKELARRKAYVILKEDTKGFKPNWKNEDEEKYYVAYSYDFGGFVFNWNRQLDSGEKLYFATEEDAEASIRAHEKEWKTWLGVEE